MTYIQLRFSTHIPPGPLDPIQMTKSVRSGLSMTRVGDSKWLDESKVIREWLEGGSERADMLVIYTIATNHNSVSVKLVFVPLSLLKHTCMTEISISSVLSSASTLPPFFSPLCLAVFCSFSHHEFQLNFPSSCGCLLNTGGNGPDATVFMWSFTFFSLSSIHLPLPTPHSPPLSVTNVSLTPVCIRCFLRV